MRHGLGAARRPAFHPVPAHDLDRSLNDHPTLPVPELVDRATGSNRGSIVPASHQQMESMNEIA